MRKMLYKNPPGPYYLRNRGNMRNSKKIDHALLKLNNRLEILRVLRESGPMSRNELKEKTGLSWGTITAFIKELMDMRVVVETGKESSRLGRKPVGIDLDTSHAHGQYEARGRLLRENHGHGHQGDGKGGA